jgi:hypothetical protein
VSDIKPTRRDREATLRALNYDMSSLTPRRKTWLASGGNVREARLSQLVPSVLAEVAQAREEGRATGQIQCCAIVAEWLADRPGVTEDERLELLARLVKP